MVGENDAKRTLWLTRRADRACTPAHDRAHIDAALVLELIDTGTLKDAGSSHYWLCKHLPDRTDNLLCVAAVIENAVVVKTIMHHWEPAP
jgi:hypothetical protein